ncbi:MAG: hypothetical protein AAGA66_15545 [Bacteroidota bacterium]
MMKHVCIAFLLVAHLHAMAQSEAKTYDLKKGQVLDLICLSQKQDTKETLQRFFQTAIPFAQENSYTPLNGWKVLEDPTQGNFTPQSLILGRWASIQQRARFTEQIEQKVPDFHEMRRAIWSAFYLTYWEVPEDLSFAIDPEKVNVVTAYWEGEAALFSTFKEQWVANARKSGGTCLLELTGGSSPFGYHYNPDYLVVTAWESREAFETFKKHNLEMDHSGVKHVNQFIVQ